MSNPAAPNELLQMLGDAVAAHQTGRLDEAEALYRRVLDQSPENADALHLFGLLEAQRGRLERAETLLNNAARQAPGVDYIQLNYGNVLQALGRLEAALASYDNALAINANSPESWNNRGVILRDLKRFDEALESYDRAVAINPQFADALVNRGVTLRRMGRLADAVASYDQALAIQPNAAEVLYNRGNVLRELERFDEAVVDYDQALRLKPQYVEALNNRGHAFREHGKLKEALDSYNRAIVMKADYPEAHFNRGNVLRDLGHFTEAMESYDRAIALRHDYAEAYSNRGNILRQLNREEEARANHHKAIELAPEHIGPRLAYAGFLVEGNDIAGAIAAYKEALARGGDATEIGYYLAALGADAPPDASPQIFVRRLFDRYAETFDEHAESLEYFVPKLLHKAVAALPASPPRDMADLGCGTGLCGPLFKDMAKTMVGVDLSPGMLDKARERDLYDELVVSDITTFMQGRPQAFDLIVATDVFIYIGDLDPVFAAAKTALRAGGQFAFSIEEYMGGDFELRRSRRYAQSLAYIRRLGKQYGFTETSLTPIKIRHEEAGDIPGFVVILTRLQ